MVIRCSVLSFKAFSCVYRRFAGIRKLAAIDLDVSFS